MRFKRHDDRPAQEPILALIDVVFFLLVFFMLVARLDASAPFDVIPPRAATGQDLPGGGVTLSIAKDGALAINGESVSRATWLDVMKDAQTRNAGTLIRINAHRAVALRHVLPVIETLEAAALGEVVLIVTPSPS